MYDVIIIGAGPAGLSSALYLLRANKKVLLLEAKSYGGQIINAYKVENYPGIDSISGFDYATNLYRQVINLGGEIRYEMVTRINDDKTVFTDKNEYKAKAIIIATGATNRRLNVANEREFLGKGVSYCATCDGNFYRNKDVAVVGGGNTALEDALYLSDLANKVYLIHRRDEFNGEYKYLNELRNKNNVEFVLNSTINKIIGDNHVEKLELINNNNESKTISVNGLFIAIGQEPKNEIFANIVELDQKGYIKTIEDVKTKTNGIYVAGDTRVKELRQLTTAVSDGAIAASIAIKEMK